MERRPECQKNVAAEEIVMGESAVFDALWRHTRGIASKLGSWPRRMCPILR